MNETKTYIRDGRSPVPSKEITSRIMSSIKDRNTGPELAIRKALWNNGIKGYRLHWKNVPGRPDIAFPSKKIAIFINGCYWHRCPHCKPPIPKSNLRFWENKFEQNVARDKRNVEQLGRLNWNVLVLWECQIKRDTDMCLNKVSMLIN